MSLSEEKIRKNFEKFYKTCEKYGFINENLMDFLGASFIEAPASTSTKTYNAFKGGLIDHVLRVTKYAVTLNESLPEEMQVDKNSLVKVCCLHQIGKVHLFTDNPSQWHKDNLGKMYEFNNDLTSMTVGERSAFYCMKYDIKLTDEEFQAIVNYSKIDENDKQSKWYTATTGKLLRIANEMAIMESKFKYDE